MNELGPKRKIAVLLECHEGERWSAYLPLVPEIVEEGDNPEEATNGLRLLIEELLNEKPDLGNRIFEPVEFLLTEIEIKPAEKLSDPCNQ